MPYPVCYPRRTTPITPRAHHVGLFYWCAYWRHWDEVISVDGVWVVVVQCDDAGQRIGEPRRHCTMMEPAMFADKPFPVTYRVY